MVSGKNPLPAASSSGLAFDGPLSQTVTLSGSGNCLALWQVEWVQGELFIFPNKSKEGLCVCVCVCQHHVDFSLTPVSPEKVSYLTKRKICYQKQRPFKLWLCSKGP